MTSKPSPPGRRILIAVVTARRGGASRPGASNTTRSRPAACHPRHPLLLGAGCGAGAAERQVRHAFDAEGVPAVRLGECVQGRQRPGNALRRGTQSAAPERPACPPVRRHLRAPCPAAMPGSGTSPACVSRGAGPGSAVGRGAVPGPVGRTLDRRDRRLHGATGRSLRADRHVADAASRSPATASDRRGQQRSILIMNTRSDKASRRRTLRHARPRSRALRTQTSSRSKYVGA